MAKIVISAQIDVAPEGRDAALRSAQPWIDGALAQPGCIHYAWSADPHYPGRVHVFEEWDSQEELQAHFAAPSYTGMLGHLGQYSLIGATSTKYRCDISEPVYGPDGVATATFVTAKD